MLDPEFDYWQIVLPSITGRQAAELIDRAATQGLVGGFAEDLEGSSYHLTFDRESAGLYLRVIRSALSGASITKEDRNAIRSSRAGMESWLLESPDKPGDQVNQWEIFLPGLSEQQANELLAYATKEGFSEGGTLIDPARFYRWGLDRWSVELLLRLVEAALEDIPVSDEDRSGVESMLEDLDDWFTRTEGNT